MQVWNLKWIMVGVAVSIGPVSVSPAKAASWTQAKVINIELVTQQRAPDYNCSSDSSARINGTSTQTGESTRVQHGTIQTQTATECRAIERSSEYWHITVSTANESLVLRPYQKLKGVMGGLLAVIQGANGQMGPNYLLPRVSIGETVDIASVSGGIDIRTSGGTIYGSEVVSRAAAPSPSSQYSTPPSNPPPPVSPTRKDESLRNSAGLIYLAPNGPLKSLQSHSAQDVKTAESDLSYVVMGEESNAIADSPRPHFVVSQPEGSRFATRLELYRMEVGNGVRRIAMTVNGRQVANAIQIRLTPTTPVLYELDVLQDLPPGEYALSPNDSNDVFTFRVR